MKKNFDYREIEVGDLVDFGECGKLYVVNLDAGLTSDDLFWVTDKEEYRVDSCAPGWFIRMSYAKGIIEKYEDEDDWDGHDEELLTIDPTYDEIINNAYKVYSLETFIDMCKFETYTSWNNINEIYTELRELLLIES